MNPKNAGRFSLLVLSLVSAISLASADEVRWWLVVKDTSRGTVNEYAKENRRRCEVEMRLINETYAGLFRAKCIPVETTDPVEGEDECDRC